MMAIKGSLSKLSPAGENPYVGFFGGFADRVRKRDEETAAEERRAQLVQAAQEANAQVSKNQANKLSTTQKVKRYAPAAVADTAIGIKDAAKQAPERLGRGIARPLPGGTADLEAVEAEANSQNALKEQVLRRLQDKNLSAGQKQGFTKLLGSLQEDKEPATAVREAVASVKDDADKSKFIGALAEVSSYFVGGAGLAKAAQVGGKAGIAASVAKTAAGGALGGGGSAAQQDDASLGDIVKGVGIGAGAGVVASGLAAGAGSTFKNFRERFANKGAKSGAIVDKSRLLPDQATAGAPVITDDARLLDAGPVNPQQAVVSGADINDVKRLQAVERKIAKAQTSGNITPDEARSLMQERKQLLTRVQNPGTPVAREIGVIDNAMVEAQQAGNTAQVARLSKDKDFMQQEAVQLAKSQESAEILSNNTRVSSAAKNTEARAISEDLSKGFDGLPTYGRMDLDEQAAAVVDVMNTDYELAKRIALGQVQAPEGVQPSSFYKGVESRAVREGDVELMERLATESTIPKQATQAGQFNAALAYKDPESPVTAIRSIMDARKASNLDIPRTIAKEEADKVVSLAQDLAKAKEAIASGGDRMAYGQARIAYDDYVYSLIAQANKKTLKEALKHPGESAVNAAGVSKSLRASLDNSALLRQGWKTLFTHPGTWAKNSAKSFQDFVRTIGGREVMDEVRADIVSRPNNINGMYKKMGVDAFGIKEEAFPSTLPERAPGVGRFFKASDTAYTAFQQRTRADLADKYLEIAQRSGVDLTSKKELRAIGKFVNSLTSRGDLGRTGERAAKVLNNVFFSPRLLKSNIDVLTAHQFQRGVTPFVRKRAARNLLQIAAGSAAALKLASEVTGGKNEWDPRSSNFGKVKIGDTRFDLSGGMGSIITLGARIAKLSSKSSTTGEIKALNSGEFGASTTLDTIYNFFENKTSPAVSVMRDVLKGEDFDGNKPTVTSSVKNLVLPLIIANYQELKDNPRASSLLPTMIAESLGISVNTYGLDKNWNSSDAKSIKGFKERVGEEKFNEANDSFNEQFNSWYEKTAGGDQFWKLPQDKRESLVTSKREALKDDVMKAYGYEYKAPKKSNTKSQEDLIIEQLKKY